MANVASNCLRHHPAIEPHLDYISYRPYRTVAVGSTLRRHFHLHEIYGLARNALLTKNWTTLV